MFLWVRLIIGVFAEDESAAQTMNEIVRDKGKNVFVIIITIFKENYK